MPLARLFTLVRPAYWSAVADEARYLAEAIGPAAAAQYARSEAENLASPELAAFMRRVRRTIRADQRRCVTPKS